MSPFLTLCMIVRNEAAGIARTLRSAKPWIDRWCIFDTGSADDTRAIVQAELEGVLGVLEAGSFVDFATTRNRLLDLASHFTNGVGCLLLLDADDVLEGGEQLRSWLGAEADEARAEPEVDREAFLVRQRWGASSFATARVVRASAVGERGWSYTGAVHEVLVHPSGRVPTITIPGVTIAHERTAESEERSRARWERDAELLTKAILANGKDARAWFYLARTWQAQRKFNAARTAFLHRVELGGWREEVFAAKLGAAMCSTGHEKIARLLEAAAFAPHRAEPLIELSNVYRNQGAHRLAFLFAQEARRLPFPGGDVLFVDTGAHGWVAADCVAISAWYCGEHEIGIVAAREALAACPPEHRERCARTLAFYENGTR